MVCDEPIGNKRGKEASKQQKLVQRQSSSSQSIKEKINKIYRRNKEMGKPKIFLCS